MIEIFVPGDPVAQGSMKHVGHGRIIHSNDKALRAWRERIAHVARSEGVTMQESPNGFRVNLVFILRRPKSVSVKKRPYPTKKPDVDKLTRAVLDALTGVVWGDDAEVVRVHAEKVYDDCHDDEPGVWISIACVKNII